MKQLLLFSAVMICLNVSAQRIYFSDSTNHWGGTRYEAYPPASYPFGAGYYWGDTIINNTSYKIINSIGIREDRINGKIYCRFLTPYTEFIGEATDTAEHLFFDYNLNVGDTFRVDYGRYHSVHHVGAMSTVMINGMSCKTWTMIPDSHNFPGNLQYIFVEGVGTLSHPISSVCNWFFESGFRLLCFRNNKVRSPFIPPVGYFDNTTSCALSSANIVGNSAPLIAPNPVNASSIMKLPEGFDNGQILFTDVIEGSACPFTTSRRFPSANI